MTKQPRPTDTDWRKERLRITIYHVAWILIGLFILFVIAGGFNNIPVS